MDSYEGITNKCKTISLKGLKLAKLGSPFIDELDKEVSIAFENFCEQLKQKGVHIEDLNIPEAKEKERTELFPPIVGSEIISAFGLEIS